LARTRRMPVGPRADARVAAPLFAGGDLRAARGHRLGRRREDDGRAGRSSAPGRHARRDRSRGRTLRCEAGLAGGGGHEGQAAAAESVAEEARELAESGDRDRAFEEMGDLLFAIVSLARTLKVNPEDALRVAGQRFRRRFATTEASVRREGKNLSDLGEEEKLRRWEESR